MYFKPCVKYGNIIFGINSVFIGLNVWGIQLRVQRFFRGQKQSWDKEVRTKTEKQENGKRVPATWRATPTRGPSRGKVPGMFWVYATKARGLGVPFV